MLEHVAKVLTRVSFENMKTQTQYKKIGKNRNFKESNFSTKQEVETYQNVLDGTKLLSILVIECYTTVVTIVLPTRTPSRQIGNFFGLGSLDGHFHSEEADETKNKLLVTQELRF